MLLVNPRKKILHTGENICNMAIENMSMRNLYSYVFILTLLKIMVSKFKLKESHAIVSAYDYMSAYILYSNYLYAMLKCLLWTVSSNIFQSSFVAPFPMYHKYVCLPQHSAIYQQFVLTIRVYIPFFVKASIVGILWNSRMIKSTLI